jgi:DNA primase large subunit
MISVTSTTNQYILQPTLLGKHKKTLEWLSAALLWKRELAFFQKLLDQYASRFISTDDKKQVDHFQNIILYYNGELVDTLSAKLRLHEKKLAEILETRNESKTEYFKEHDDLMNELDSLNTQFNQYKEELFNFIEKVM